MEDIIKISHLNKSFGQVKAVNDLSFCVKRGELFAFLGVNGAGKSTTISIICSQLKKDSGSVEVQGIDADKAGEEIKRMFGVVFQDSVLDKPLSVRDNLKCRAALYGITGSAFEKRLQDLIDILDFGEFLDRPVGKLSGGQRRRSVIECDTSGAFRKHTFRYNMLSAENPGSAVCSRNHSQCGIRLYLRSLYAYIQFQLRFTEDPVLPAGNLRNIPHKKPHDGRRF